MYLDQALQLKDEDCHFKEFAQQKHIPCVPNQIYKCGFGSIVCNSPKLETT